MSENPNKALALLNKVTNEIYSNKKGLLCKQAEEFAILLEPNL